jgi:ribosomal RNA assembly protein
MMKFSKSVRIPEERIKELLELKNKVEEELAVKLLVKGNDVSVSGESVNLLKARDVVVAVGRGFDCETAMLLLGDDYCLDVIDVKDYAKTQKAIIRLKGRVIGDDGRAKRFIEKNTGCFISVYGKTVAIIGKNDDIVRARRAVIMLLEGAKHATAYRFLEEYRRV